MDAAPAPLLLASAAPNCEMGGPEWRRQGWEREERRGCRSREATGALRQYGGARGLKRER